MEIKRVGENKIRCALTEDEIREMGFDIDESIGNGEATQKFMRVVLKIVEEQENISLENISIYCKAKAALLVSKRIEKSLSSNCNNRENSAASITVFPVPVGIETMPNRYYLFHICGTHLKRLVWHPFANMSSQKSDRV